MTSVDSFMNRKKFLTWVTTPKNHRFEFVTDVLRPEVHYKDCYSDKFNIEALKMILFLILFPVEPRYNEVPRYGVI